MKVTSRIERVGLVVVFKVLLLMGAIGCGKSSSAPPEDLVPVSGKIKLGGEPINRASVTFTPTATNIAAHTGTGVTDSDGEFEMLNYRSKRGLPAGTYIVTVSLVLTPDGSPPPDDRPAQSNANQVIPDEWNSIAKAGTHNTVTVPEDGKTDFEFEIPKKN